MIIADLHIQALFYSKMNISPSASIAIQVTKTPLDPRGCARFSNRQSSLLDCLGDIRT